MNKKIESLAKEALGVAKVAVTGASQAAVAVAAWVYAWDTSSKFVSVGAGLVLGGLLVAAFKPKVK